METGDNREKKERGAEDMKTNQSIFSKNDTAVAKLAAIVLMMLHHLFGFPDRILPEYMWKSIHMFHGQPVEAVICASFKICVAIFLFLSGYGTYVSLRKRENVSAALAGRIRGLLVFVWEVMLIYVPIDFLLGVTKVNIVSSWSIRYDFESIILSMLGFEKYNGEWWFIMPFIMLLMMTPLLMRFVKRRHSDYFTDFLVVFGLALFSAYGMPRLMTYGMFETFAPSVWGILLGNVVYLLPIYLMGMVFARHQVFSYFGKILPKGKAQIPVLLFVAAAGFYLRYKVGSSYDFFLAGPIIYAVVNLLKPIPGVIWMSRKLGRYITLVWLIHSFYIFQFGQKFVYSFRNPVLIFIVLAVLSFCSAAAVYWLFRGIGKGIKGIAYRSR